jgi:hypothetical protein
MDLQAIQQGCVHQADLVGCCVCSTEPLCYIKYGELEYLNHWKLLKDSDHIGCCSNNVPDVYLRGAAFKSWSGD